MRKSRFQAHSGRTCEFTQPRDHLLTDPCMCTCVKSGIPYRFYLAFENSMCDDYVTEKLFDRLMSSKHPLVPVVMGGADYAEIVPERSVIDVRDFEGPADLAR